jgi:hypothetical protein
MFTTIVACCCVAGFKGAFKTLPSLDPGVLLCLTYYLSLAHVRVSMFR